MLDSTYEEVDNQDPGIKSNILRFINLSYDQIRSKCIKDVKSSDEVMTVIKSQSDFIMTEVKNVLKKTVVNDPDLQITAEELEFCLVIIVCHAFIACKILEEPPQ